MKQKPTEYKRNRSLFFSLAYLSDGLFYASSTSPQCLNIVNIPSSRNPTAEFLANKKQNQSKNRH